jgi:hypothetical protein
LQLIGSDPHEVAQVIVHTSRKLMRSVIRTGELPTTAR